LNAARVSCGDHPPARQAGHPGGRDPPLPASQHQPEEPRSDDGNEHDRNDPMLAGQLFVVLDASNSSATPPTTTTR
jgi:hypothetical protein